MPTPKSVSQIKSLLLSPALTSHFEVEIGIPQDLQEVIGVQQERINLMCSEATLPGSQLTTLELNNDRTGVNEKHAYRRLYDGKLDLTFYVDAKDYIPIRFFETWIHYITNENQVDTRRKNYSYRVKYPDEYISDQGLIVRKFERDYKQLLEYEFIRSFPLAINSMPVSYESSSLLKCTVSMSYIRYVLKGINAPGTRSQGQGAGDLAGRFNANTAINTPFIYDSSLPSILGDSSYNFADYSDAFTPIGQAQFNTSQAFNVGIQALPVSEQISRGQQ